MTNTTHEKVSIKIYDFDLADPFQRIEYYA